MLENKSQHSYLRFSRGTTVNTKLFLLRGGGGCCVRFRRYQLRHRFAGTLLACFVIGAVGTVIGTVVAAAVVPLGLGGDGWKIASALAARHIGGAVNYVAVSVEVALYNPRVTVLSEIWAAAEKAVEKVVENAADKAALGLKRTTTYHAKVSLSFRACTDQTCFNWRLNPPPSPLASTL